MISLIRPDLSRLTDIDNNGVQNRRPLFSGQCPWKRAAFVLWNAERLKKRASEKPLDSPNFNQARQHLTSPKAQVSSFDGTLLLLLCHAF